MSEKKDVTSEISWLGTLLKYIKEHGISNILKALIILFMLQVCHDPTFLFEKYSKYMEQKHTEELQARTNDDKKVKDLLPKLLYSSGASRVWIIQYHNGISDWQYGSMRFELPLDNVESIKEQYDHFHLSWLNLPDYLKTHNIFIGDLDTLKEIDNTLFDRFNKNKIQYLACILLKDELNTPTGILGFTWEKQDSVRYSETTIKDNLIRYGAIIEQYIRPNIVSNAKVK